MTSDLKERIKSAIHKAIEQRRGSFTGADIAADVINTNFDLWCEWREVVATEKLAAVVNGVMRGPLHELNSAQLPLAGFEDLPKYIRVDRKWMDLRDAIAEQLSEFINWYRGKVKRLQERTKRDRRVLAAMLKLVRLMARYEKQTPGISVGQVLEIREVRAETRAVSVGSSRFTVN